MRSPCTDSGPTTNSLDSTFVPVKPFRLGRHTLGELSSSELDLRLIGNSDLMHQLKNLIRVVAPTNETVLITGESGTGKELIARAIHDSSPRRNKPYVAVNCGAFAESLLESELFGHVKGAFTGAAANKKGFFESARGGTIFLDEFAEMSLVTQQRFLRVLQEGTIRPVGNTEASEIEIDARIIVATNHDLKRDISEGKFRHDLYYRVNVLQSNSPALRDRREDISALAEHFIHNYNDKNFGKISERISSDVLAVLEAYSWPGNVRELENIIKRLALSASNEGVITRAHLHAVPEFDQLASASAPLTPALTEQHQVSRKLNCISGRRQEAGLCRCNELQLDQYRQLVDEADGNLAEAARRLKLNRTTLRKRIVTLQKKCVAR